MLSGRTILVVGSTAGMGAEIYRLCIARGAEVFGVGRNRVVGEAMAAAHGGRFHTADIGDADQILALFDWLVKEGVTIDGAVNNAAMTQPAVPIDEMDLSLLDRLIAINLRGTWLCVSREVAMMRAGGGAIVNIASIAGKRGLTGLSAYCATKHGVIGLTRAAALDGARSNIRVNAVLPGTTRTAMMEEQMVTRPGGLEATLATIPLGRIAEPAEQAEAAIWLLSDQSRFVTGECLTVDGGRTVRV